MNEVFHCKYCGKPNSFQRRGTQMNKYLHVCLGILGKELGYTMDEIKTVMKYHFGYYHELASEKTGETIIVYDETSKMNSKQCSEFIEQIIRFAAEQGINIESPEEHFNKVA